MSFALKMILAAMKKQPPFQIGAGADYEKLRAQNDDPSNQIGVVNSVKIEKKRYGGVETELLTPQTLKSGDILFYIHGGGYVIGSTRSSRGYGTTLADELGMRVITITYRLAPEHKFPAAQEDCFAVYQDIVKNFPNSKTALIGESGGGTMVLATGLMAKAAGVKMPACIVSISPCTNLAEDLPSRKKNEGALVVSQANITALLREAAFDRDTDPYDPLISPFFGDYTGFPPMYFFADRGEVLFDDTDLLVPKLRAAGVDVGYEVMEGTFHSFPTLGRACPESKAYLEATKEFLLKYLG